MHYPLVFHRKVLCEARVNFSVSSYFQTMCALRWDDPPSTDILWPRAELDHLFRWSVPIRWADPPQYWHLLAKSRIRSSFQITCPHQMRYPLLEASGGQEEYYKRSSWHSHIFRWDVPSDDLPQSNHRSVENHYTN